MQDSPGPALRHLVTNTAIFIRRDAAIVLRVAVGDVGVATDTGGTLVGTYVPTLVVTLVIGTLLVDVTCDLILGIGGVGWTVSRALVVTRL